MNGDIELLREVAAQIRQDAVRYQGQDGVFLLALANWLEAEAREADGRDEWVFPEAAEAARAYAPPLRRREVVLYAFVGFIAALVGLIFGFWLGAVIFV